MTWKAGDLVRVLPDPFWWYICRDESMGLVSISRNHDPCFSAKFPGGKKDDGTRWSEYPAVIPLDHRPEGGDGSVRIRQGMWNRVREMNSPELWEKLRTMDYGWLNSSRQKGLYKTGETIPENPDPLPRPEAITTVGNIHRVVERKNNATRIEAYLFSETPPDAFDKRKLCYMTSINEDGEVQQMGAKFPLQVAEQAWLPDEALELYEEPPQEKNMSATLDFLDVSHHNGAVDWLALRDNGIKGGIAKVWDGYFMPPGGYAAKQHFDSQFKNNWNGMAEYELRGAYLFGRFDTASWRPATLSQQVAESIMYIGQRKAEDIYMLDIEQKPFQIEHISKASRMAMLIEALQEAEAHWPKKFIWIYTGAWWWDFQMPATIDPYILEFPVMCANYPGALDADNNLPAAQWWQKKREPKVPNGWSIEQVIAWQYSDKGMLDGNNFDVNDFLWDWDAYFDTINPTPPPPPEPTPDNSAAILNDMQAVIDEYS